MPWTSNSIFEARRNFVMLALKPYSNIRGLCRHFNISAKTGYQTLERYRAEGEKGLQDHSRTPHRTPTHPSLGSIGVVVHAIRCNSAARQHFEAGLNHRRWPCQVDVEILEPRSQIALHQRMNRADFPVPVRRELCVGHGGSQVKGALSTGSSGYREQPRNVGRRSAADIEI
jgi:hypothetical protein